MEGLQRDQKMCDNTWREGGCATIVIKAIDVEKRQAWASAMLIVLLGQSCSNLIITFAMDAL
jgi:hypothetical protein